MNPARLAAVRVLLALDRQQTTLASELERARHFTTDERDRGLVLELTAGTLRWRNELDALLASCSKRPLDDLSSQVRAVLRLGAYQLRHLDRIPAHAVVHESVELIKHLGQIRASGFVNAVLRTMMRKSTTLPLPPRPLTNAARPDQIKYLSTALSHPEWLVSRWLDRYGFDAAATWCDFNNRAPEISVRVLPTAERSQVMARLREAGVDAIESQWVRTALRLPAGGWNHVPANLRGVLVVQDEASQIVALAVGARPAERVLDTCAAPGGKTLILAEAMAGQGQLVAADYRPSRMRLLTSTLGRGGAAASLVQIDASRPLPFGPGFDRVLLDAPCSGLGVVRRDPDIKWTRTENDLADFARRQRAMIAAAADAVRPGGTLVYATCSSEPEENEHIVEALLTSRDDFTLVSPTPGPALTRASELMDVRGMLRTLPFLHGLDAYFCAVLVRRQAA